MLLLLNISCPFGLMALLPMQMRESGLTTFRQTEPSPDGHSAVECVLSRKYLPEEEPAVDMTRIEELRALQPDDPEGLMHELVEIFLKSAQESLQQARQAIQESAPKKLVHAAHFLKGSCAQFGAHRVCTLCSTLEESGLSGSTANTLGLLNEIERQFQRVCASLVPYL
jgi:HPt (histidine-containing phosphotransfer) domain-containing protein